MSKLVRRSKIWKQIIQKTEQIDRLRKLLWQVARQVAQIKWQVARQVAQIKWQVAHTYLFEYLESSGFALSLFTLPVYK